MLCMVIHILRKGNNIQNNSITCCVDLYRICFVLSFPSFLYKYVCMSEPNDNMVCAAIYAMESIIFSILIPEYY